MKIKLLIISVICLSSLAFTQYGEAGLMVMSIEEMAERSDAIVIGTIQSTWIDFRPFDDRHVVVDTAKIKSTGRTAYSRDDVSRMLSLEPKLSFSVIS